MVALPQMTAAHSAPAQTPPHLVKLVRKAWAAHQEGRLAKAERLYKAVLEELPSQFNALHLLGVLKWQRGQHAEALRFIAAALKTNSRSAEALSDYGLVLHDLDRHDEALASYEQAIAINPMFAEIFNNRGNALRALDRPEDALESFERALIIKPGYLEALYNRGSVLRTLNRLQEALETFDRVLAAVPNHFQTLNNRGNVLLNLDRPEEALASYERALAIMPSHPEILNNRGHAFMRLNRLEEALDSFEAAANTQPDHLDAINSRGAALIGLNRIEQAISALDEAAAVDPNYSEARWNQGLARLAKGDFRNGWKDYEWRWEQKQFGAERRSFSQPQWLGDQPVEGKTILLHAEQGSGDTLQFVRYAPLLAQRGAKIILEVQRSLVGLLSRMPGIKTVVARGDMLPPFDLHSPLLSLPLAFGTELETIPKNVPYVTPPADRVEFWRARLGPSDKVRVGLAWAGNPSHSNDRNRSIALKTLSPILSGPVEYVSLQQELREGDAELIASHPQLKDCGRDLRDFSDTAAIMSLLDLVITVDTSVAHLAGAMGRPVWILLPFAPDFRWMLDREDSPWYPTARLFRQPKIEDWENVVSRLQTELGKLVQA
jgi:tetratricopeptide (TPR) repeat protein